MRNTKSNLFTLTMYLLFFTAVQSVIGKVVHKLDDKNLEVRSYLPFLD